MLSVFPQVEAEQTQTNMASEILILNLLHVWERGVRESNQPTKFYYCYVFSVEKKIIE